jgi:hypothetical protein
MHTAKGRQFSLEQSTDTMFRGLVPFFLSETTASTPSIKDSADAIASAAVF